MSAPLSSLWSLDVYLSKQVQNKKIKVFATALQRSFNALYSERVRDGGIISPIFFCQHCTSSVVLIQSSSSSLLFVCMPLSPIPFFPDILVSGFSYFYLSFPHSLLL